MSGFKVTDRVRMEEAGVIIRVINVTKGEASHLDNRKGFFSTI